MSLFVEFVGCSGAGKTTVASIVASLLAKSNVTVYYPLDLFPGRSLTSRITSESFANVILDVLVLPWLILSLLSSFEFVKFARRAVWTRTDSLGKRILLMRSILRKVGLSYYIRQRDKDSGIILVDEGIVHSAHVMFINGEKHNEPIDLVTFSYLVPKPDMVVYVDAPLSVITERTLKRKDPPVTGLTSDELADFVARAHEMFNELMDSSLLSNVPVLKVSGSEEDAEEIVEYILTQIGEPVNKEI